MRAPPAIGANVYRAVNSEAALTVRPALQRLQPP